MKYLNPVWFYVSGPLFSGMVFFYILAVMAAIVGVVISIDMIVGFTHNSYVWLAVIVCTVVIYLGNLIGYLLERSDKKASE